MSNEVAFANWWARQFPDYSCPPVPRELDELGLTQQMAMKATAPDLYTAMFAGRNDVRLPADVSVRLSAGQLQPGDAGALRAAGYESQAQQCERLRDAQQSQRLAEQAAHSRAVYEQAMKRTAAWQEMGLLERLSRTPLTPEQIDRNRRRYGLSE